MAFCKKCGSAVPDSGRFCQSCGAESNPLPSAELAVSPAQGVSAAVAFAPVSDLYYVSSQGTGQISGPFNGEAIQALVVQQRVTINDSIAMAGSQIWAPILQSKFASLVTQQANQSRIASSTCPRCSAGMAVVIKRSGLGLALVLIGIALTPVFGIGIPIFIIGFIIRWGGKGTASYRCPRCNYST